jgi:hypothetical protein
MLALLLLQAALPTVGDTIWIERTVPVPPGYAVRAPVWEPSGSLELLAPPTLVVTGGQTTLRYPVVAWDPGSQAVRVPGPLLVSPAGDVDSLPAQSLVIEVASVLPRRLAETAPPPQPAAALIPLQRTSPVPLILLGLLASALLFAIGATWRRRGPAASIEAPAGSPSAPPVDRWARAGESRAVAAAAMAELRQAIAARVPDAHAGLTGQHLVEVLAARRPAWPLPRIAAAVDRLEAARFAPMPSLEVLALHDEVSGLVRAVRSERP